MEKFKFGDKVICKRFNNPKLCTFIRYDYGENGYCDYSRCIIKFGIWHKSVYEKYLEIEEGD